MRRRDIVISGLAAAAAAPALAKAARAANAHAFQFDGLTGGRIALSQYRGRALLVVNTASKCGLTPQYKALEALWRARRGSGLTIVGVPSGDFAGQELASNAEIQSFCELNYGVSFPMAAKSAVVGPEAHPFYRWAASALGEAGVPRWNFHKILIGPDGRAIAGFGSRTAPDAPEITAAIDRALRAA
jgi:glutathione peroxidase